MKAWAKIATLFVSAILVSEGVVSGELGANHELTEKTAYDVAVAEVSTKSNWVKLPNEAKISARDLRKFSARNDEISSKVDQMLQQTIEQKIALLNAK